MYHVFLTTLKGYRTVLQACWYLDLIKYGVQWPAFYSCDPHDFFGKNSTFLFHLKNFKKHDLINKAD